MSARSAWPLPGLWERSATRVRGFGCQAGRVVVRSRWHRLPLALVLMPTLSARGQEKSINPGINKSFENPDVEEHRKRFEAESREVYAHRAEIVEALGLRPGMAV